MIARKLAWDLIAAKVTRLRMEIGIGEVLDEISPGPTSDFCDKMGCLSEQIAPFVNIVSGALYEKLEVPSHKWKLAQPNQGTIGEQLLEV